MEGSNEKLRLPADDAVRGVPLHCNPVIFDAICNNIKRKVSGHHDSTVSPEGFFEQQWSSIHNVTDAESPLQPPYGYSPGGEDLKHELRSGNLGYSAVIRDQKIHDPKFGVDVHLDNPSFTGGNAAGYHPHHLRTPSTQIEPRDFCPCECQHFAHNLSCEYQQPNYEHNACTSRSKEDFHVLSLESPNSIITEFLRHPSPVPMWYPNVALNEVKPLFRPDCEGKGKNMNFRRLTVSHASHPNDAMSSNDINLQRHISNSLENHGVCVIDRFLGNELGSNICQEARTLHSTRICQKGESLGGGRAGKSVRDDMITWVNGSEPECPSVGVLCRKLDAIVAVGDGVTSAYQICGSTKAMVARYPGNGAGYQRHVDNPAKDGRCLTCLYYINKDWESDKMGGILRLNARTTGKTADISPIFDRIVIFYSDKRNPHEVLPTYSDRYAITLWYFDREERKRAIERMASTKQRKK